MSRYHVDLTCPQCGAEVDHVAAGQPSRAGSHINAVCRCAPCRRSWLLTVTLRPGDEQTSRIAV